MNQSNKPQITFEQLDFANCAPIYHYGPSLAAGPLPAFFYFSLSGPQSLQLDPFNQPVMFLASEQYRVFSLSLPGHTPGVDPQKNAIKFWYNALIQGENFIETFVAHCHQALDTLIQKHYVDPSQISVGGLSRGAFMATHWAAQDARIKKLLGFAPLTRLDRLSDFPELEFLPLAQELSLMPLIDRLVNKQVAFYIGNCDKMVHTQACFEFIHSLAEAALTQGQRSPNVRLTIFPSIGHKGHGTPPEIFKAGIEWLKSI